jgi:hypothetical protein
MRTDGQRDKTKSIVDFRSFAKAPKNGPQSQEGLLRWSSVFRITLSPCVILEVGRNRIRLTTNIIE